MRIGILTGGGDVPGLNPCIKAVVNRVAHEGHEVVGLRRGWAALLEYDPDDPGSAGKWFLPLDPNVVRTIDRYRRHIPPHLTNEPHQGAPGEVPAVPRPPHRGRRAVRLHGACASRVEPLGIDVLIADRRRRHALLRAAHARRGRPASSRSRRRWTTTSTAPTTASASPPPSRAAWSSSTTCARATGSHERIAVVELFGRYSGETSLITAYLAGVDRALISEVPFDIDRLAELLVADKRGNPSAATR